MRRKKGDNQGIPHPPGTGWAQSCNITKTGTVPAEGSYTLVCGSLWRRWGGSVGGMGTRKNNNLQYSGQ